MTSITWSLVACGVVLRYGFVSWQQVSVMTRWSCRVTAPGAPVAGSVCHAACRAASSAARVVWDVGEQDQALLTMLFIRGVTRCQGKISIKAMSAHG